MIDKRFIPLVAAVAGIASLFLSPGIVQAADNKQADDDKPFTVRRGDTVLDVAKLVHKDIARGLKFARIWGSEVFDGQQVGPDHIVADGDIVELHSQ